MFVEKYQRTRAIPDGNCAFNAFIIGLCQPQVLDKIEKVMADEKKNIHLHLSLFIERASKALDVHPSQWSNLKTELVRLRHENPYGLQKKLASIMRVLACDLLVDTLPKDDLVNERLLSAYYDFHYSTSGSVADDVFIRHSFVHEKFKALKLKYDLSHKNSLNKAQTSLMKWWKVSGCQQFIKAMRGPSVYAGDIELIRLGAYFRINLQAYVPNSNPHAMYTDFGCIPVDHLPQQSKYKMELYHRLVVNRPNHGKPTPASLVFFADRGELKRRMGPVVESDIVLSYLKNQRKKGVELKGQLVPDTWSAQVLKDLNDRNVITRKDNGYVFILTVKEALCRIRSMPEHIISAILAYSKKEMLPSIVLQNAHEHWDLLTVDFQTKLIQFAVNHKFEHASDKWKNWREMQLIHGKKTASDGLVEYTIVKEDNHKELRYLTPDEQLKGDEAFAEALQQEEYDAIKNELYVF